jgi:hypothetical protein
MVTLTINDKTRTEDSLESALTTLQTAEVVDDLDLRTTDYYICIGDNKLGKDDLEKYLNL